MAHPTLACGTALLGMHGFLTASSVSSLLSELAAANIHHIDTAARYPPPSPGGAEQLLGAASRDAAEALQLDTKILLDARTDGRGALAAPAIRASVDASLRRLGVPRVGVLYCHGFDAATPLAETVRELDRQCRLGRFERWGVCGFSAAQVRAVLAAAREAGCVPPKVYQGEYNVLSRGMEAELLPLLRENGMHFFAHRPLATGFLSGRFTAGEVEGTRFDPGFALSGIHKGLYDHERLHGAVRELQGRLDGLGIETAEAALRWIVYHSALGEGDCVIFGASKVEQVRENARAVAKGALPGDLAEFMSGLWEMVRDEN